MRLPPLMLLLPVHFAEITSATVSRSWLGSLGLQLQWPGKEVRQVQCTSFHDDSVLEDNLVVNNMKMSILCKLCETRLWCHGQKSGATSLS